MKKLTVIAAFLGTMFSIQAQDLNTHYLYQMNWFNINPAYAGDVDGMKAIINPGTQWLGLDGNPTNTMIGLHGSVGENIGLGGKVVVDKRGIFNTTTAEGIYSYKLAINDEHKVRFGVSAGLFHSYIDQGTIFGDNYTDASDPTLAGTYYNTTRFLASFGAIYRYKDLELGGSMPHLIVSGRPISNHAITTAKYDFKLESQNLKISPMVVYQYVMTSPRLFDFGAKFEWNEMLWAQSAYRTNKTIAAALGVNFKKFELGYLYNINNSPLNVISNGSHEVLISFTFDKKERAKNEPIGAENSDRIYEDLSTLNKLSSDNPDLQNEIAEIQKKLSQLLDKLKSGNYSDKDDIELKNLEGRIIELKKQYSTK